MSLYIGNLSEHARRDELERVFRRFGHCYVQLKREGYGFVVFDFPSDAEKALRALKGRKICGEPLILTWSNKQPKSKFPRFGRGGRRGGGTYELQHVKNFDRLGFVRRKVGFDGWRNHKMGVAGRGKSVEVAGEEGGHHEDDFKDYVGEKKDYGEDFPDEGGGVVPNLENDGRWDEPNHDLSIDNRNGNAIEFDRYEPYHGYDRRHHNEDYHTCDSGGSSAANSQENMRRAQIGKETSNHLNDSKFQPTCYRCGESGHKIGNCPKEHSSQTKYNRLDVGQNNKIDENRFGSGSWVKLQSSGDALSKRHQRDNLRLSSPRPDCAPLRSESSPVMKDIDGHQRKENRRKKRSSNEIESPKRPRSKISRLSISSSLLSDFSASGSRSNSQSSKSLLRSSSHSRSRSVSSRAHSSSSKLRSSSKSWICRGKSLISRRSNSPASLSVSLDPPLTSPNKIQSNSKNSSNNGTALESVNHSVAHGQQIGSAMELENPQSKDTGVVVSGKANVWEDNNENCDPLNPTDGVTNLSKSHVGGNLSPLMVKETEGFEHSRSLMMDDIPSGIQKPAAETHLNPHSGLSNVISTEEMCMVLNSYGLEFPKDYEKNLTVDAFFGAARLWPWHIVYYRRLKKGPISTENYARRVAQNQEFGIVDKYIRSSSGWGRES